MHFSAALLHLDRPLQPFFQPEEISFFRGRAGSWQSDPQRFPVWCFSPPPVIRGSQLFEQLQLPDPSSVSPGRLPS